MSESTSSSPLPNSLPNGNNAEYQKHWFCAAQTASGELFKQDAESAAGFLDVVRGAPIAWVDCRTDDFEKDAVKAASHFGFSEQLVSSLIGHSRPAYQDFDTEMGMRLPSIQVGAQEVTPSPLLLLLRRNFVLTIHPLTIDRRFMLLRRYSDAVLKKIPVEACPEDKLTLLLMRIIDENNERNFEHLRDIEERGDALNEALADPRTPREALGPKIFRMKHDLIVYLNSLWETVDVLHALRHGDAELITNDERLLDRMGLLMDGVNRQISLSEHMADVLASGLEVLQSIYNNQLQALNNRLALVMTYLTIVGTAVLVPNTIATIFSSAAFDMGPEDVWWYVLLLVASTVAATFLAYLWVRKMGWLPKKVD
jgi:magnesium transporter